MLNRVRTLRLFRGLSNANSAQGLSEYALVLSVASLAAIAALTLFGWSAAGALGQALGQVVSSMGAS
ncbi:MAG: hypothetical protein M3P18_05140 [Actinomycetota bacterium]|nr:hypothetical protein [Actinomycetota bacterium]